MFKLRVIDTLYLTSLIAFSIWSQIKFFVDMHPNV